MSTGEGHPTPAAVTEPHVLAHGVAPVEPSTDAPFATKTLKKKGMPLYPAAKLLLSDVLPGLQRALVAASTRQAKAHEECRNAKEYARARQGEIEKLMTSSTVADFQAYRNEKGACKERKEKRRELYGVAKQVIEAVDRRLVARKHPLEEIRKATDDINAAFNTGLELVHQMTKSLEQARQRALDDLPEATAWHETEPILAHFHTVRDFVRQMETEVSPEVTKAAALYNEEHAELQQKENKFIEACIPQNHHSYCEVLNKKKKTLLSLDELETQKKGMAETLQQLAKVEQQLQQGSAPQPAIVHQRPGFFESIAKRVRRR